jgi:large subunit ribosomal protein L23
MPREIHPYAVLLRPIITEKTTLLTGADKYVFEVDRRANKNQIREAVQVAFNVRVADVNTMTMKGKPRRWGRKITKGPDWKKAVVTLVQGDKIELFEGI